MTSSSSPTASVEEEEEDLGMNMIPLCKTIMTVMGSSSSSDASQQAKEEDLTRYLPLYKAVIQGDWDTTKTILDVDPNSIMAKITVDSETTLHVAAWTQKATHFFSKLLDKIPTDQPLETLVDDKGYTLLHSAAVFGNMETAKILVERNKNLPNIWSKYSRLERFRALPLHAAALNCHRELTLYLYSVTNEKDVDPNPFTGELGVWLLNSLIYAEFYDIALQVVQRNPKLGILIARGNRTPLDAIAEKSYAFPSGTQYTPWQWFIYFRVPVKSENISGKSNVYDLENPCECILLCTKMGTWARFLRGAHFVHVCQEFHRIIWSMMEILVPQIKSIKETKHMHSQTLQLVKCLCMEIASLDHATAKSEFIYPVHRATRLGIHEVVGEILESFPVDLSCQRTSIKSISHELQLPREQRLVDSRGPSLNGSLVVPLGNSSTPSACSQDCQACPGILALH